MKFSAFLIATSLLASALPASAQDAKIHLRVLTSAGKEMTLTNPTGGDWRFECGDLKISFVLSALAHVERTSAGGFKLTTTDGVSFEAFRRERGVVSGEGDWGRAQVDWNTIQSVDVTVAGPAALERQQNQTARWQLTPITGPSMFFTDLQIGSWKT